MNTSLDDLERLAITTRRRVIELSYSSKSGHIGSSLSCVDLLVALYERFLRLDPAQPAWPERDRFIMSKGHACTPYYVCLSRKGFIPAGTLAEYGVEGGVLGHHPHKNVDFGIDLSTGSLGHGLSVGSGIAFGAKLAGKRFRTVVMMSDGEQNEGAVWEATAFARHHALDQLLAIVDFNKMQALGDCGEIMDLEPLDARYRAAGWGVRRIDGHSMGQIVGALNEFPFERGRPSVIVADTVKGKGVSFMEGSLLWHYRCPDPREYEAALAELQDA
ncbi:MAG: transketolase [Myxococcales bacterium]|nr:transketolase [Myxococcales bacterium]